MLLGYPYIKKTVREFLAEFHKPGTGGHGSGNGCDPTVFPGQSTEGVTEYFGIGDHTT